MTTNPSLVDEAEGVVRQLADDLTQPRPNECLCCYVVRMLDEFSCDGTHRHAFRLPRRERAARGCDCEMFLNAYLLQTGRERRMAGDPADGDEGTEPVPPCQGVRRGSVRACGNWLRVRPYRRWGESSGVPDSLCVHGRHPVGR